MKLLHLSDLHIGKIVNGFSMINDQKYILNQILQFVKNKKPDVILLAGDIYDKQTPSGEAIKVFDQFLTELVEEKVTIFLISGNHDSPERLSFLSRVMKKNNLFFYTVFDGTIKKITLSDKFGKVDFYLLPFIKPNFVKYYYKEEEIKSYDEALKVVLEKVDIDTNKRNVLLLHQFVVNSGEEPLRFDSEIKPIGGVDSVNVDLLQKFDYVALGHLHGAQKIGQNEVYYCGSPLKYSFSEHKHNKTLQFVDLLEKNEVAVQKIPLIPKRDLRKIKGPIKELLSEDIVSIGNKDDYLHITLTDEDEIMDVMMKVRNVYKNVMVLEFENKRTTTEFEYEENVEKIDPFEMFESFFELQNGTGMTKEQRDEVLKVFYEEEHI